MVGMLSAGTLTEVHIIDCKKGKEWVHKSTSERDFVFWKEETRITEIEPGLVVVRVAHEDPWIMLLTTEVATEIGCLCGKVVGIVKLNVMDFVNGLAI